jgi:multidrug efflux pump
MMFIFALGLCIVFLVLAAQFESFIYPLVIIMTVPLAMVGGLVGLYLTNQSLNIYSQIGLLTLVGLAAKNGILIVEFVGQMRDRGTPLLRALLVSSKIRLRPILMTSLTAVAGAVPLMLSTGAGAETRSVIGVVIFFGVLSAMIFTIFIVPAAYNIIGRFGSSPRTVEIELTRQEVSSKTHK